MENELREIFGLIPQELTTGVTPARAAAAQDELDENGIQWAPRGMIDVESLDDCMIEEWANVVFWRRIW